ncbi:MAG: hypothetical protein HYU70_00580 [Bacteroidetes bacterium]|nr:hypothetical protein [Bacteroidota bacterium]
MNISKIITDYIETPDSAGAILINGQWGIGKSVYWRNTIVPAIEQLTNPKTGNKYKCLYVSLNGISSTQDIIAQLQLEKLPESKGAALAKARGVTAFKILGQLINREGLTENILTTAFESLADFSDNVICFDDLERNTMQEKIMGYINTQFVERKNTRVIVIGDESKITMGENYHRIKEKLFFRVIQFDKNLVGLFDILSRYQKQPDYHQLLQAHQPYIQSILDTINNHNLRTLIFALDCMRAVYLAYPGMAKEAHIELVKSLLLFTLLISFEFKAGDLTSDDYADHRNLDRLSKMEYGLMRSELFRKRIRELNKEKRDQQEQEEEKRYEARFYNKYEIGKRREYYFFPSVYRYVLTGELIEAQLAEEIAAFDIYIKDRDKTDAPQVVAYNALRFNYELKTEQELQDYYRQFVQFAKAGDYPFTEYGVMYDLLKYLKEWDFIEIDLASMKKEFLEGCQRSIDRDETDVSYLRYDDVQRIAGDDPEFKPLIQDRINMVKEQMENEKANIYLEALAGEFAVFNEQHRHVDPFQYATPAQLFSISQTSPLANNNLRHYFADLIKYNSMQEVYKQRENLQEILTLAQTTHTTQRAGLIKSGNKTLINQLTQLLQKVNTAIANS